MSDPHEQRELFTDGSLPSGGASASTVRGGRCLIHDRVLSEQEQLEGKCWWCKQEGRVR